MAGALPTPVFEAIAPEAAGMPLYRVAKRSLMAAIESGRCPPGGTLPSEAEIAGAMHVSIGTLRRAVGELVDEQVLVRRQGLGTFVATHGAERALLQFAPLERSDGRREAPRTELLSFERGRADAEPAQALQLRIGDPVIQIECRLSLQGCAVVFDLLTLPAALFKGLTERRVRERPGTLYQLYQAGFGVTVLRANERAAATAADRRAAQVLGIAVALPVMRVRRTALTFGDRPVEYRVSIVDTTHHDYVNPSTRAPRHD